MQTKIPKLSEEFKLPNPGLRSYFAHTDRGQPDDFRPPFFKGKPREEVLNSWQKVLDSLAVKEKYPSLYQYEMEMKAKVGPMSIQKPLSDRLESIENYYTAVETSSEPLTQRAIDSTIRFFRKGSTLRLRNKRATMDKMRLSTNSGSPYFTKRSTVKEETLNDPFHFENGALYQKDYRLVSVLGWRGQEGGIKDDDVKQRVIWMMPVLLNLLELQFYQPAIEMVQSQGTIPAYISMDAVDQEVTKLFDTKGPEDVVICTDFTKFDQHFNADMQDAAKQILRGISTDSPEMNDWFENVFPIKFKIPLVCDEHLEYIGSHGMGSGSGGTNFDECMAHKALQFECAQESNQELNPHSMAYGDDGILTYPGIKVEDVIRTYTKHGQEMNETKQYVSKQDCVVLRRWHGTNYRVNGTMVGVYATMRALGRLLAQERFYDPEEWGPKMVELRQLSIIENCKWSPYFHEFIDWVMTGDKYRLGLDLPGFLDNIEQEASQAIDKLPDFLGYTKTQQKSGKTLATGISQWEVVKYLKSKR